MNWQMKYLLSLLITILGINSLVYFCQWLMEVEFNVLGWFALYAPLTNFEHRADYFMQGLLWIALTGLLIGTSFAIYESFKEK